MAQSVSPCSSMLCCVSRRAVAGADQGPPYDQFLSKVRSVERIETGAKIVEDDVPSILLPCTICARTFMPQSLEKHTKICQQSAHKKRKPFDSAKQRIQGTDLAEFLPKQEKKRYFQDERSSHTKSSWKENHDDFLRAIRAARSEIVETTIQKQCNPLPSAPTRSNEQGMCPTCNRHFGIKAYDRHVAWCKERVTRVPLSAATNIAKERLEARMKYRAPALKNRRATTREKYSPGSATVINSATKTLPTLAATKAKESSSVPSCVKNDSPVKQRSIATRRSGQPKESSSPSGPMKSRPIDRTNRQSEDEPGTLSFRPASFLKRASHIPVPPLKSKKQNIEDTKNDATPRRRKPRRMEDKLQQDEIVKPISRSRNEENKSQMHSARSQKMNIVSARSLGNPKVNDVAINAGVVGMVVQPCTIRKEELVTWKQISQEKCLQSRNDERDLSSRDYNWDLHLPEVNRRCLKEDFLKDEDSVREKSMEEEVFMEEMVCEDERKVVDWTIISENLNQTYSVDNDVEILNMRGGKKWKPVRHSPRVEFRYGNMDKYVSYDNSSNTIGTMSTNLYKSPRNPWKASELSNINNEKTDSVLGNKEIVDSIGNCDFEQHNSESESFEVKSSPESIKKRKNKIDRKKKYQEIPKNEGFKLFTPRKCTPSEEHDGDNKFHVDEKEDTPSCEKNFNVLFSARSNKDVKEEGEILFSEQKSINGMFSSRSNKSIKEEEEALKHFIQLESLHQSFPEEKTNDLFKLQEPEEIMNNEDNVLNEEIIQLTLHEENNEIQPIEVVEIVNNENDFQSFDVKEGSECSYDSNKSFVKNADKETLVVHFEPNDIETETEIMLTNDGIRSSTPFGSKEELCNEECQSCRKKKHSSDDEWKFRKETETGVEILHCMEDEKFEYFNSSSHIKEDEVEYSSCMHESLEISASSKSQREDFVTAEDIEIQREISLGLTESNEIKEETLNKEGSKDIASQANMCNCLLKSGDLKFKKARRRRREEISRKTKYHVSDELSDEKPMEKYPKTIDDLDSTPKYEKYREYNENEKKTPLKNSDSNENDCNDLETSKDIIDFATNVENTLEEAKDFHENFINENFDYDSENTVDEAGTRDREDDFNTFIKDTIVSQNSQLENSLYRDPNLKDSSKIKRSSNVASKIRRSSSILYNNTENLISAMEPVEFTNISQTESVEVETIEEIGTRNRSITFRILPEIKSTSIVVRDHFGGKERLDSQTYWERASKTSKNKLINLDPPTQSDSRFPRRNPKVCILPPVPSGSSLIKCSGKDYDPFLLAEQQMNDLLSDTSDQSITDGPSGQNNDTTFPLSHSSAFVKYPSQDTFPNKRSSLIAPPTEFDDLTSDFSSDSTETNSLSREVYLKDLKNEKDTVTKPEIEKKSPSRELGRRVIIDKSKALGGEVVDDRTDRGSRSFVRSTEKARKILDKVSPKVLRPAVNRSHSVRASSAPKTTPERKTSNNFTNAKKGSKSGETQRTSNTNMNNKNNNYGSLSGSNLSLSSIVSSEVDIKRSNSVFDELMTSFEDDNCPFPSLRSFLKPDSLSISSSIHGRQRNGQNSDEEFSSPESYKRQDHSKLSADSAYSSLNRKYSNHGRSTNDVAGRFDDDVQRNRQDGNGITHVKCKWSKFCHECGFKFPEPAKFCCECGIRRLAL